MVCLGIIIDDFRGPHFFYLLQRKARQLRSELRKRACFLRR